MGFNNDDMAVRMQQQTMQLQQVILLCAWSTLSRLHVCKVLAYIAIGIARGCLPASKVLPVCVCCSGTVH